MSTLPPLAEDGCECRIRIDGEGHMDVHRVLPEVSPNGVVPTVLEFTERGLEYQRDGRTFRYECMTDGVCALTVAVDHCEPHCWYPATEQMEKDAAPDDARPPVDWDTRTMTVIVGEE